MTNREKLIAKINQKIIAEQTDFKKRLLQLPAEQILERAYEFVVREDLLSVLPDFIDNFDDCETEILSQFPLILDVLYLCWTEMEFSTQEMLEDVIMDVVHSNIPEE